MEDLAHKLVHPYQCTQVPCLLTIDGFYRVLDREDSASIPWLSTKASVSLVSNSKIVGEHHPKFPRARRTFLPLSCSDSGNAFHSGGSYLTQRRGSGRGGGREKRKHPGFGGPRGIFAPFGPYFPIASPAGNSLPRSYCISPPVGASKIVSPSKEKAAVTFADHTRLRMGWELVLKRQDLATLVPPRWPRYRSTERSYACCQVVPLFLGGKGVDFWAVGPVTTTTPSKFIACYACYD